MFLLREFNNIIDFLMFFMYFTHMIRPEWRKYFEQACIYLEQHDPKSALHKFSEALRECPANEQKFLGKIIFYTGITFKKLGMDNCALKTWKSAMNIDKHSLSAKMFRRYSNNYGMPKQEDPEQDDYQAFLSIQTMKYLAGKTSGNFSTEAENDMVNDLITESWINLKQDPAVRNLDCDRKLDLFYSVKIYFPFIQVPKQHGNQAIDIKIDLK